MNLNFLPRAARLNVIQRSPPQCSLRGNHKTGCEMPCSLCSSSEVLLIPYGSCLVRDLLVFTIIIGQSHNSVTLKCRSSATWACYTTLQTKTASPMALAYADCINKHFVTFFLAAEACRSTRSAEISGEEAYSRIGSKWVYWRGGCTSSGTTSPIWGHSSDWRKSSRQGIGFYSSNGFSASWHCCREATKWWKNCWVDAL